MTKIKCVLDDWLLKYRKGTINHICKYSHNRICILDEIEININQFADDHYCEWGMICKNYEAEGVIE